MKIQEGRVEIRDEVEIGTAGNTPLLGDIFLPPLRQENRPAILLIHGGGWMQGDRKQLRGYGILLARLGFVCICNSYRLSQEAPWPAQIQDVNCALRFMRAHSKDLGIDPERIGVSGNSAGGHLSLMSALEGSEEFEGEGGHSEFSSSVKAVCAIYPPTEIKMLEKIDPLLNAYGMLMGIKATQEDYAKASPIKYDLDGFPPTMLVHGSTDDVVNLTESTNFYQKLVDKNIPAELHIFAEEMHAFDGASGYGRSVADLQALFFSKYL